MLTYQQAIKKIAEHSFALRPRFLPLGKCLGRVVSRDIVSPVSFPCFDNSAVDGYAVSIPSAMAGCVSKLKFCGEVPAGNNFSKGLEPCQAVRIFTGAPIPQGTTAVVMQEHARRVNGSVVLSKPPEPLENIRFRGEDFQKERILVRKKTLLGPARLALLAAVGLSEARVYPSPKTAILATGSELLKPGERQRPGKIWDANTLLLDSMVKEAGGQAISLPHVGDRPKAIEFRIRQGLKNDLFLISGGVSVGDYDFVREALRKEGVREIFWKVDIKPGKPLFFGKKGRCLVFGLPGNPVSAFVTFEEFVKPVLGHMQGRAAAHEWTAGILADSFKNGSRLHFARARVLRWKRSYRVFPLKGQGSHRMGELAASNALLRLEPHARLKKGGPILFKWIQGNR